MGTKVLFFAAIGILFATIGLASSSSCRCIPSEPCWPSSAEWTRFNSSISGKLIQNIPPAAPCYTGIYSSATECAIIEQNWTNGTFLSELPIGYSYPHTESCGLPGGNTSICSLGDSPVFAVNASIPADVIAGVKFARRRNLRLVVKMTGHDILGRSTGYGSLEIWLKYLRQGVLFEDIYVETSTSRQTNPSSWNGSAMEIGGGYSWSDVYPIAAENGVIVVGGGCPNVGALGGYTQGGGHSLAMRDFGLAADQLLEAQVVLSNGQQVLASPTSNSDLFKALRGGGGGTYGIIISAKVKAYPDSGYSAQTLYMAPLSTSEDHVLAFMEATAIIYEAFPMLDDGGLSGYGAWSPYDGIVSSKASMTYSLGAKGKTVDEIENLFAPTADKLNPYNGTSLIIVISYTAFSSYWDYYYGTNGVCSPASPNSALVSRLFTGHHLSNGTGLRTMLNITAGTATEGTVNGFSLVGGGAVFTVPDAFSGVNPAWRKSYVHNYCGRGWSDTTNYSTLTAIHHDITYNKGGALRDFAPDTGAYMNEGDWQDPEYLQDFYGDEVPFLKATKGVYDPDGIFYCPTCIGSEKWEVTADGALCKKRLT